jgi:ATP-dependent phosphoenolpyruvate carboxykinase
LVEQNCGPSHRTVSRSSLAGPDNNPEFRRVLDELVTAAILGQRTDSEVYNPSDQWLKDRMRILQNLPPEEQQQVFDEAERLQAEAAVANAEGRAAHRAWPEVVVQLDNQGLDFFSQLGVVRRPDLTHYYIDGFGRNRDALAFNEENQALFTEVFRKITQRLKECFAAGETVVQTDRQIGDAPGRSFHARQLLFGTRYLQVPYMWRQLTFDLPESEYQKDPDILEVSIPCWMEDLGLSEGLKDRIRAAGLTQLIFKAPTKGLSLHLGFDYVGEHKMGPLSITMYLVKQNNGLAVQAALSMARARTLSGTLKNTAVVTIGPSLHGKSTLTIMIELAGSDFAQLLRLPTDPEEGVCPMNDDIVLLQPLNPPIVETRGGNRLRITHGIDGTENNFYAVPFGLTREDDPITYDVLRGTRDEPNSQETLENVPVHVDDFRPNYMENPVRNMRMILSRTRLLKRKGTQDLIGAITGGRLKDSVHVPMTDTDQVFFQAVMRQNTVVPPLRRLTLEQYIRVLMYGEAVQMGAAIGAIGRPYVEYFSDPFIIGLEDENANLMYYVLQQMERGGLLHHYYVFNTGGVGADTNEQAAGARYKKIPRELTLMLQEALLREAVKFHYDATLRSDIAVAIVDRNGNEVMDLRQEWLPINLYGEDEYTRRALELRQRRYFGRDAADKAGILRYTKVTDALIDLDDIPTPTNERELAWLMSFYWKVDQAYNTLTDLVSNLEQGHQPMPHLLRELSRKYGVSASRGLNLTRESQGALKLLGIH